MILICEGDVFRTSFLASLFFLKLVLHVDIYV